MAPRSSYIIGTVIVIFCPFLLPALDSQLDPPDTRSYYHHACSNCMSQHPSHGEPKEADELRLNSIKQQILSKLGLKKEPNITSPPIPKEVVWQTLSRADGTRDFLETTHSPEPEDDFYGRTSEIITFAEPGLSQEPTISDATCNVVDVPTASGSLESTLPQQPTPNVASTQTASLLDEIAPVPTRDGVRRLSPRSATRLTSPDHVEVLKSKQQTRLKGASQKKRGGVTQTMKRSPKTGVRSKVGANAAHSSHASSDPTNYCAVCNGYYYDVDLIKVGDWVKCVKCHKWCHEACLIQRTSNTLSRVCPSCVS